MFTQPEIRSLGFASGRNAARFHAKEGEKHMMLDGNAYDKQIGETMGELMKRSPDMVRGYRPLGDANAKASGFSAKTRELISLAVAVTHQCDGCIVAKTPPVAARCFEHVSGKPVVSRHQLNALPRRRRSRWLA